MLKGVASASGALGSFDTQRSLPASRVFAQEARDRFGKAAYVLGFSQNRARSGAPGVLFDVAGREHDDGSSSAAGECAGVARQLDSVVAGQIVVEDENVGEWVYSLVNSLEGSLRLDSIGCVLQLTDVYDRIVFPAEESEDASPGLE